MDAIKVMRKMSGVQKISRKVTEADTSEEEIHWQAK